VSELHLAPVPPERPAEAMLRLDQAAQGGVPGLSPGGGHRSLLPQAGGQHGDPITPQWAQNWEQNCAQN